MSESPAHRSYIPVRITLGEMRDALNRVLQDTDVSETAAVMWAEICEEGGQYETDNGASLENAAPGGLVLGIEQLMNGEWVQGILQLQPAKISNLLN